MDVNQYVNSIVRHIKCGGKKRREIRKQLRMDIDFRLQQGETPEDIMAQMGTAKEIADEFNEGLSDGEKKRYTLAKVLKIVLPILAVLALFIFYLYWLLPKSVDIEKSRYFDKTRVEAEMKRTVELLDAEDYTALQEDSTEQMRYFITKEEMDKARALTADDWGSRQSFGTVYLVEMVQGNTHMAVGEITVSYENVSVIYRLTYDTDMKLAGIYIR